MFNRVTPTQLPVPGPLPSRYFKGKKQHFPKIAPLSQVSIPWEVAAPVEWLSREGSGLDLLQLGDKRPKMEENRVGICVTPKTAPWGYPDLGGRLWEGWNPAGFSDSFWDSSAGVTLGWERGVPKGRGFPGSVPGGKLRHGRGRAGLGATSGVLGPEQGGLRGAIPRDAGRDPRGLRGWIPRDAGW